MSPFPTNLFGQARDDVGDWATAVDLAALRAAYDAYEQNHNGVWTPGATFPASPAEGDLFYETDTQILWVRKAAAWFEVSGPRHAARVGGSGSAVGGAVWTKLVINNIDWDESGCLSLPNDNYTVQTSGVYALTAAARVNHGTGSNDTVNWITALSFFLNGVEMSRGNEFNRRDAIANGDDMSLVVADERELVAGNVIDLRLFSTYTGDVGTDGGYTHWTVRRVGPLIP